MIYSVICGVEDYREYFIYRTNNIMNIPMCDRLWASAIFEYKDGDTIYHKNKAYPINYQYTEEEMTVIGLKAKSLDVS